MNSSSLTRRLPSQLGAPLNSLNPHHYGMYSYRSRLVFLGVTMWRGSLICKSRAAVRLFGGYYLAHNITISAGMMDQAKLDIGCRAAIEEDNAALGEDDAITMLTPIIIPPSMNKLFAGMARVSRDAFIQRFDVGVPMDPTKKGNEEVMIFYSDEHALPHKSAREGIPKRAVEHCDNLKIILTEPGKTKQCLAKVGQWESYHIQRFIRWEEEEKVKNDLPLRYVSRVPGHNGRVLERPHISHTNVTNTWDEMLVSYFSSLNQVLERLRPIAKYVARNNTIVVMV